MLDRHVIILAQGQQTRLPELTYPKQLLQLRACGGVPLIVRTIMMVRTLDRTARITVIGDEQVASGVGAWKVDVEHRELLDPGNSSLKGCARYLEYRRRRRITAANAVVLLGDVCYSWPCMLLLMRQTKPYVFVGTSNLSNDSGEMWGVAWRRDAEITMATWMDNAMQHHPPFVEYQCGQLRQWLFAAKRELVANRSEPTYAACDDYTRDFDVPADLEKLDATATRAAEDDVAHGLVW